MGFTRSFISVPPCACTTSNEDRYGTNSRIVDANSGLNSNLNVLRG
jgi:hypothetical protein